MLLKATILLWNSPALETHSIANDQEKSVLIFTGKTALHFIWASKQSSTELHDFSTFADPVESPARMTSNHTDCHYCLQSLRGRKYALREENAYCVACYDSLFANPCEECKQPIECDSKVEI